MCGYLKVAHIAQYMYQVLSDVSIRLRSNVISDSCNPVFLEGESDTVLAIELLIPYRVHFLQQSGLWKSYLCPKYDMVVAYRCN